MKCTNCDSIEFDVKDEGYYCKYCGTFYPKAYETKKINWDKYDGERINNYIYIKNHTPKETILEKFIKFILICFLILVVLIAGLMAL